MNNYEYIIASLPVLDQDTRNAAGLDVEGLHAMIAEQLDGRDKAAFGMLLAGFDPEKLDADFYRSALSSPNGFIREYFKYDLDVRNTKVEYLNNELGRPSDMDVMKLDEEDSSAVEFDGREEVMAVLTRKDILGRERGLDDLMWKKCEDLTLMHVFDMDVILGFTARLQIIDRWLKLDPETGRELFRRLVKEIRNSKTEYGN